MGTPDFARDILARLADSSLCEIVAVYCQPDRPAGRGKKLTPPPVKVFAQEQGFAVHQPLNFKDEADRIFLQSLAPDVLVVAAYGLILPQAVLDIPRLAPINVHGSLLPKYRGAAPVQRAIMDLESESGVCIMKMEAGLDTGPVYARRVCDISAESITSPELLDMIAQDGSDVLLEVLQKLASGETIVPTAQDESQVTYASKLRKDESFLPWHENANIVHAHIRAMLPWPGSKVSILRPEKEILELQVGVGCIGAEIADLSQIEGATQIPQCGELWRLKNGQIAIATSDCWYILDFVCPKGKREMPVKDFANGYLSSINKSVGFLAKLAPVTAS